MVKHTFVLSLLALFFASQSLYSYNNTEQVLPTGQVCVTSPAGTLYIQGKSAWSTTVTLASKAERLPTDCCTINTSRNIDRVSFLFEGPIVDTDASLELYSPRNARISARVTDGDIYMSGCTRAEFLYARKGNITINLIDVTEDLAAMNRAEELEAKTCHLSAPAGNVTFILPANTDIHERSEGPDKDEISFFFGKTKFTVCAKEVSIQRQMPLPAEDGRIVTETTLIFPK